MRAIFNVTLRPIYRGLRDALERLREKRAGIETRGYIHPEKLFSTPEHRNRYQPAPWSVLRRILRRGEVGPDDVFVDLGSGMGRVVFQAAWKYPFRRVIGVELSDDLNEIARSNIAGNLDKLRCQEVTIERADVMEWTVPDDVTVVFFNNPFRGPVFAAAVQRLVESLERQPRPMRVIYYNPNEHQMLLDAGFRHVRTLRGMRPGKDWSRSNATYLYER